MVFLVRGTTKNILRRMQRTGYDSRSQRLHRVQPATFPCANCLFSSRLSFHRLPSIFLCSLRRQLNCEVSRRKHHSSSQIIPVANSHFRSGGRHFDRGFAVTTKSIWGLSYSVLRLEGGNDSSVSETTARRNAGSHGLSRGARAPRLEAWWVSSAVGADVISTMSCSGHGRRFSGCGHLSWSPVGSRAARPPIRPSVAARLGRLPLARRPTVEPPQSPPCPRS